MLLGYISHFLDLGSSLFAYKWFDSGKMAGKNIVQVKVISTSLAVPQKVKQNYCKT